MAFDWKYLAKAAAASVAGGAVVGFVADRIFARIEEERAIEVQMEDEYLPEIEWEDVDADEIWDIPEGVNEIPKGKPSFEMEKPDLSDMVDYGAFYPKKHSMPSEDGEAEEETPEVVHVISEEEFVKGTGNLDGYVSVTGTYFPDDGVLAGWDDALEEKDIDATVGRKVISMFDHPDVDAVYVRNDVLKVLYEIVRGEGSRENALSEMSYSPDDEG